MRECERLNLLI